MSKTQKGFVPLTVLFLVIVAVLMFGASSFYLVHQIHLPTLSFLKSSSQAQSDHGNTLTLPKNSPPAAVTSSLPPRVATPTPTSIPTAIPKIFPTATPLQVNQNPTYSPTSSYQPSNSVTVPYQQPQYSNPNYYVPQPTTQATPSYQPIQTIPSTINSGSTQQPSDLLSVGLLNITISPNLPVTISVYGVNVSSYTSAVSSISYQTFQSGTYKVHFSYQNTTYNGQYIRIPDDQTIQINNHQTTNLSVDLYSGEVQSSFLWAP